MTNYFWEGFFLGFAIAAPVGPIAILCIRKTLQFGKISGLSCGLGAAAADTAYGSLAAFGLTFFSHHLNTWGPWLRLIGSFFLFYLAYRSFHSRVQEPQNHLPKMTLVKDFIGTFFLTLTNPLTFLCYLAVFAALGLTDVLKDWHAGVLLVTGVLFGSTFWWLILCESVGFFRKKVTQNTMLWVNRISGFIIGAFGLWSFLQNSIWGQLRDFLRLTWP